MPIPKVPGTRHSFSWLNLLHLGCAELPKCVARERVIDMERPASQRNIFSQSTIRLRKQRLPDGKDGHDKNMKSPKRLQQNRAGRTSISRLASFFCLAVFLLFAVTANAQNVTQLNVPTTTTLWAGTQDWNQFGLSSVTVPASGVILPGTAISSFTGQPVRHLWYGDPATACAVSILKWMTRI